MFPRNSLTSNEGNYSWTSPSRTRELKTSRFSMIGGGQVLQNEERNGCNGLGRRSSFNTFSSGTKTKYNSGRPSMNGIFDDPQQQQNRSAGRLSFAPSYDVEMIEEDREQSFDNRRGREMPDFLFGPLSSRVPKRRSILSVDKKDDNSPDNVPLKKGILFERPQGFEKRSSNIENEPISGPPLRQLGESFTFPGYAKSPKENVENEIKSYRDMSDEEFENNCWIMVFGITNVSEDDIFSYITSEFGSILKIAKKKDTNYIFLRFSNPTIVKKAIEKRCFSLSPNYMVGIAKPLFYTFLTSKEYEMSVVKESNKTNDIQQKQSLSIRKIDIAQRKRDETSSFTHDNGKKDGIISKLWSFVNA
uniref:Nucleoporin NUP53 n=1 Tax=Parastrongyloides trichosuri TaxID=131310 RepID=A0A0N4ZMH9_PARTI